MPTAPTPKPPVGGWLPFDGSEPDVDHDTGDERKTEPNPPDEDE